MKTRIKQTKFRSQGGWVAVFIFCVVIVVAGGIIIGCLYQTTKTLLYPPVEPATNVVSYGGQTQDQGGRAQLLEKPVNAPATNNPATRIFTFQYGMASTNDEPITWATVGTNILRDPNLPVISNTLWLLESDSNHVSFIFAMDGLLSRADMPADDETDPGTVTNLVLVIERATAMAGPWKACYTNPWPIVDTPYTFSDINPPIGQAFYRVRYR